MSLNNTNPLLLILVHVFSVTEMFDSSKPTLEEVAEEDEGEEDVGMTAEELELEAQLLKVGSFKKDSN